MRSKENRSAIVPPGRRAWSNPILTLLAVAAFAAAGDGASAARAQQNAYKPLADQLPAQIAAAKAAGLPLTPADLRRNPPVPDARNAALLYWKADRLWRQMPEAQRDADTAALSAFAKPAGRNPDSRTRVEEILRRNAGLIQLGEKASALPECDFQRPFEQGSAMPIPEFASMRQIARLLAARATLENQDSDPKAALSDVAAAARIGVHAGSDRILIALLVRIALHAIANQPFVEVLQKYGDRPEVVQLAVETEEAFGKIPDARVYYHGELVFFRRICEETRHSNDILSKPFDHSSPLATPAQRKAMADAWEAHALYFWRKCDRELTATQGDLRAQRDVMERLAKAEQVRTSEPGYEMTGTLIPEFAKAIVRQQHIAAYSRLRIVAEAILKMRSASGRFPDSLADLAAGDIPPDPFTNAPLVYRKTAGGFLLYSVGQNLIDDGGDFADKDGRSNFNDIGLRYTDPS